MSNQDFFFDEEEAPAKPAPESSAKSTKPASKAAAKTAPARPASATAAAPAPAGFLDQSVTLMVAALMSVIALLVGVIIGFVVAPDRIATELTGAGVGTGSAPSLTQEQLQSGQMPEGHPDLGGMTGGQGQSATATEGAATE